MNKEYWLQVRADSLERLEKQRRDEIDAKRKERARKIKENPEVSQWNGPKQIFRLSRGSYFGGSSTYIIREKEDCFEVIVKSTGGFRLMNCNFEIPKTEIHGLMKAVEKAEYWKEKYWQDCLDGYTWGVDVEFGDLVIHTSGCMDYPQDYDEVMAEILRELNKLRTRYCIEKTSAVEEARLFSKLFLEYYEKKRRQDTDSNDHENLSQ